MMIVQVTLVVALAVLCSASGPVHKDGYGDSKYKGGRYYYGGQYGGKCGSDGLYYKDEYSFVMCSNGNSYVQPCAPGTRNSGYTDYTPGYYYGYSNFCDVNLVDFGYSAEVHSQSYGQKHEPYGHSAGYAPKNKGYGIKNAGYAAQGNKYEASAGYESSHKYEAGHKYQSAQTYQEPHGVPHKYEAPVAYAHEPHGIPQKYDVPVGYGPAGKNNYGYGKASAGKAYGYKEETSYGQGYQTRNNHGFKKDKY